VIKMLIVLETCKIVWREMSQLLLVILILTTNKELRPQLNRDKG
jgi:hypothetical protein